jgi:outer membrane protein TolC
MKDAGNTKTYTMIRVGMSVLFSLSLIATAQENPPADTLSIEQALQEGIHESPTLKKYESAEDFAKANTMLGLSGLLPHLEVKAQHDFDAQYETVPVTLGTLTAAVPEVSPRTSVGVGAKWVIFDGLSNIKNYEASLRLSDASELEFSRHKFEIRKKIQFAFYTALAAKRFEEVAEENVKTLQESMNQVQNRLSSGVATQYDALRVQVRLSDAKTELERTEDNVIIERKKLIEVMGIKTDDRLLVGELPIPALAGKITQLQSPNLEKREDFKSLKLKSEAADAQSSAAMGKLVPSVGLSANYLKYENTDYPGEAYGGYRDAWAVGVYVKWDLFDGGETLAKARMARAASDHSNQEYEESILSLPTDFELWRRRYVYSQHHFEAKKQDLTSSEESFRIATLASEQGRKTITDLLETETDLFRARAGVVQSELDAEEALIKLELTLGEELKE